MIRTPPRPILLIENSPEVRRAMVEWLKLMGYAVLTAVDGIDAIAKLRAGSRPCLILMDLQSPHSLEFRKAQTHDTRTANIPLVIYSGLYDPTIGAKQLHASAYFYTPFDLRALQRVIDVHCKKYAPRFRRAENGTDPRP